ncbi:AraC family transcriptional regulator [Roseivirga sp. E12]|uniref:helix-turn-helix domain-containing protein n=1 Tax=Roseivirga sp. E12 TaxID=2819237 RepID=UPI001ABBEBC0|nr:helix-turn-helix domain-containing protein [Roseivirga sp. E12]MBO3699785.1 AraC family transcriptional regulator [Roseivirga sp. E12]
MTSYFLFSKKGRSYTNIYLGLLLMALVIRIGKSVFFHFDSGLNENYILIGLLACVAIGPMCFYFTKSQITGQKSFDPKSLLHLTPMVLLAAYAIFYESYGENRYFWSLKIVRGIYYYWALYLLYSIYLLIKQKFIIKKSFPEEYWTYGVVLGVFLIWLAYFTSSFTSYLTGSITFSFLVYLLAWLLITNRKQIVASKKSKAEIKLMPQAEIDRLREKIKATIMEDELYKDPDLKMPALAKMVGLTSHQFSAFINEQLGQNFAQLVNSFRVEIAKDLLRRQQHLTVEAIGFDCGFNSPSTFHTTFKKATGQTPAAYRDQASDL